MKKMMALSLAAALFLALCNVPAFSEPEDYTKDYTIYKEYRNDLVMLQQDITKLHLELEKNPQAAYEHILQIVERTAELTGEAELASHSIHNVLQINLQDQLELLLILGFSEAQNQYLTNLGYTEEDILELKEWFLYYNDSYHHAVTGFTPEEVERFHLLGLEDTQIRELQKVMDEHYTHLYTAQEVVKQHQRELMQVQVSLSLAALKTLRELEKNKDKDKDKGLELQKSEEKLLQAIPTVSEDQSSLEHVKAYSKEVYKAAEREIRKGNTQYFVDFFIGLQIQCGAVTALNGDLELGLREIQSYKNVLAECASSPERLIPPLSLSHSEPTPPPSVQSLDFVGQIEESDETNNTGVIVVFVKASDTTTWQAAVLLLAYIADVYGSTEWTLGGLIAFIGECIEAGITMTSLVLGAAGAFLLLIITAPSVGEEWPSYVPGTIEGEKIIIIVEGSYGQGHIIKQAKKDGCTGSSHDAILKNPYLIGDIVNNALRLFYYSDLGQYLYYFMDAEGKEWVVIIRKYGSTKNYELVTAYRVDCTLPEECKPKDGDPIPVRSYLDVLKCEGWDLISLK